MNGLLRMAGLAGLVWISLSTVACGPAGKSQYQSWQFERAVEEMARSTRRSSVTSPPASGARESKSSTAQPKTTNSTKEYDERHPSRWKRKLKAAYA